jgi:starch synthase
MYYEIVKKMKVLFVTQEITPYLPETEMSLVGRHLPQAIQELGHEIRTFMPKFGNISERRNQLHEVIRLSGMNLVISDTDHPLIIKVASIQPARMQVYFIDNEDFFQRKHTLADKEKEFKDNDERAIFYSKGVIETVKKLCWAPDIIHCHGWFTGLLPFFMKKTYANDPLFNDYKIIYSIYDNKFNKTLNTNLVQKLKEEGVDNKDLELLQNPNFINFTKFIIDNADGIVLGSADVDEELIDYIKETGKPVMKYHKYDTSNVNKFNKFYEKLLD